MLLNASSVFNRVMLQHYLNKKNEWEQAMKGRNAVITLQAKTIRGLEEKNEAAAKVIAALKEKEAALLEKEKGFSKEKEALEKRIQELQKEKVEAPKNKNTPEELELPSAKLDKAEIALPATAASGATIDRGSPGEGYDQWEERVRNRVERELKKRDKPIHKSLSDLRSDVDSLSVMEIKNRVNDTATSAEKVKTMKNLMVMIEEMTKAWMDDVQARRGRDEIPFGNITAMIRALGERIALQQESINGKATTAALRSGLDSVRPKGIVAILSSHIPIAKRACLCFLCVVLLCMHVCP